MGFYWNIILSCKSVRRKVNTWLKYDTEEYKIESVYYSTRHVVNFVTMMQLEDEYGNIGHACCTISKCNFNPNKLNILPLKIL